MKLLCAVAVASLFILAGCKKTKDKPAETPLPPSGADITRTFYYPSTTTTLSSNYNLKNDSIVAAARINGEKQLLISFDVPVTRGHDYILFTINENKIIPGYKGDYAILTSELAGLRGDAQVNYRYKRDMFSYVEFLPGNAAGTLKITSYDEKLKLISGTYNFHINSLHDPMVGMNWIATEIDLTGRFENVQVK
jgi:hypothetical protein